MPNLQVTKQFGITLPEDDQDKRPISVDRIDLDDGAAVFQLHFADGSLSGLLAFDQLDDYAKCLEKPALPLQANHANGAARSASLLVREL